MAIGLALGGSAQTPARWWPDGAVFAADFLARRYMRDGVEIPADQAFSFTRASPRLAEDAQGNYVEFGIDQPALTSAGLSLEPQRVNLNTRLRHSNSSGWVSNSTAIATPYPGTFANLFDDAALVASGGSLSARRETPTFEVIAGTTYSCTFWYRAGSSGKVRLSCRAGSEMSTWSGALGSLDTKTEQAGALGLPTVHLSSQSTFKASFAWSPSSGSTGARLGIGPATQTVAEDIIVLGSQIEVGAGPSSPIPTVGSILQRERDSLWVDFLLSTQTLHLNYQEEIIEIPTVTSPVELPSSGHTLLGLWTTQ
jgi:hypothetical protein